VIAEPVTFIGFGSTGGAAGLSTICPVLGSTFIVHCVHFLRKCAEYIYK
jgi:hypothetical protein